MEILAGTHAKIVIMCLQKQDFEVMFLLREPVFRLKTTQITLLSGEPDTIKF